MKFNTMAVIPFSIVFLLCVFNVGSSVYKTHQFIERAGYVAETHHVTTEDGYILEMHRIPFRRHETSGAADRPVVLILHGLMGSSNNFIVLGIHNAISYNLADAGFDVWLGNARGTRNSRHHISLDPNADQLKFFDFTWNEIGMFDVPAMIDYILENTGNQRLHYIGHSQGGTAFFVMASMRPEYNNKIAKAHLLAPAGFKTNFPNNFLRNLATFSDIIWSMAVNIGIIEVIPPNPIVPFSDDGKTEDLWQYCVGDIKLKDFCILAGVKEIMNNTLTDDFRVRIEFGGASFKQVGHFGQNIRDDSFRQWNYGTIGNIAHYGSRNPPTYNLSRITADVDLHYTVSDTLVGAEDVHAMAEVIPNSKVRRVARESFRHVDFIAADDVRELVTLHIIDAINNFIVPELDVEITEPVSDDDGGASTIVLNVVIKMFLIIITLYHVV